MVLRRALRAAPNLLLSMQPYLMFAVSCQIRHLTQYRVCVILVHMKSVITKIKPRGRGAEVGRYCYLCGRGMSFRLGGLDAAGYDAKGNNIYAHVKCKFKAWPK